MKKQIIGVFIFVLLSTTISLGQQSKLTQKLDEILNVKYKSGVAILNNGDTLQGRFEFNDCQQNYRLLVYLNATSSKKSAYNPEEVKIFALEKDFYIPYESKDGLVFMRILLNDSLKLYLHKQYYTSDIQSGVNNQFYCIKPTGEKLIVSTDNSYPYKSKVSEFFADFPALCNQIKNGKYARKDLYKIALIYNDWLQSSEKILKTN